MSVNEREREREGEKSVCVRERELCNLQRRSLSANYSQRKYWTVLKIIEREHLFDDQN